MAGSLTGTGHRPLDAVVPGAGVAVLAGRGPGETSRAGNDAVGKSLTTAWDAVDRRSHSVLGTGDRITATTGVHVRISRPTAGLLVAALVAATAAAAPPATAAEPPPPDAPPGVDVSDRDAVLAADLADPARVRPRGENRPGTPGERVEAGTPSSFSESDERGYPRRTQLRIYPDDPADRSVKLGLVPYHELAPRLNDLQAESDRVSVEVLGESVLGRDIYLVTLTAPETPEDSARQRRWRDAIRTDPRAAAADEELRAGYKAPMWFNANIHGDEWEGTDGSLRVIEQLATSEDPEDLRLLETSRLYFTVSHNPDGRVAGTRQNAAGFDLNRDFVTVANPETEAVRKVAINGQSLVMLDLHGYVNPTLLSPNTAPHVQNAEYDLYLKHAWPNALGMERAIAGLGHPETQRADIPIRDRAPGDWDDWLPMYTPMYAMLQGTHGHTVEVPLRVNRQDYENQPVAELRRRAAVNTDVAEATILSTIDYVDANRDELVADQIEFFRRAGAGEQQRRIPDDYIPGFGEADRYTTEFPRGYVIPAAGEGISEPAAARLVNLLLDNGVEVRRTEAGFRVGREEYPPGSYLVDLRQPRRAIANSLLEDGADLTERVPRTYANSALSHGLLWGAEVAPVRGGLTVRSRPVEEPVASGGVDVAPGRDLAVALTDGSDIRAVNDLLGRGHQVHRSSEGVIVVPASARADALAASREHGVRFTEAPSGDERTPVGQRPVVAAAVSPDELVALRGMGFEVRPVSTAVLNEGFDWRRVDVLYVSAGLELSGLREEARADLTEFLGSGGVVTRGAVGARFNTEAGLLPVDVVRGRSDANGIVEVGAGDGWVGSGAAPHSFVYSPLWFEGLGDGVTVEQRYGPDAPLVAGHWRPEQDGTGGQVEAAGRPAVVSGVGGAGTPTVLFGTEPLFRDHPKGLYSQVARALYWTASS
ncbi:M14 family zinc carboxypeptidase [Actinoalloteichus caeruleus]|uniref:Zinc carboxypeptidase n=1 Tax=Actinoalloteichus caeruleus DSM 43889 TaxID=1120930 RepID=A0ABT1JBB3_ACTCY|nr:M14 family zinc carboxypeptidase [Actinoalloteichus caeruleus]MCP2329733.1 Zinc carboxypeptidase [Actinoalloteichus caeruleus DSM 43889]